MSNNKDLLQEVNKAIVDILEAILQAMFKAITEKKQLEQEFLTQVYRAVGKEMGNQLAQQLKEQMGEVKISKLELPDKPQSLHLVHDKDGKSYELSGLDDKGRIELSPVDGKGENIHLDPKQLGFSPKVEKSLLASAMLTQKSRDVIQLINQSVKQWLVDKKPFMKNLLEKINHKILQPDLTRQQMKSLEERSKAYQTVEYTMKGMEQRLSEMKDQLGNTKDQAEITKLATEQQSLTSELGDYEKWKIQVNDQLSQEIQTHVPDLAKESLEKLSFYEKEAIAETAFSNPDGMTHDQLRDQMLDKGNELGLEALDKAEGREIEEMTTETSLDIDMK